MKFIDDAYDSGNPFAKFDLEGGDVEKKFGVNITFGENSIIKQVALDDGVFLMPLEGFVNFVPSEENLEMLSDELNFVRDCTWFELADRYGYPIIHEVSESIGGLVANLEMIRDAIARNSYNDYLSAWNDFKRELDNFTSKYMTRIDKFFYRITAVVSKVILTGEYVLNKLDDLWNGGVILHPMNKKETLTLLKAAMGTYKTRVLMRLD
jgi:hypothetical protein